MARLLEESAAVCKSCPPTGGKAALAMGADPDPWSVSIACWLFIAADVAVASCDEAAPAGGAATAAAAAEADDTEGADAG